ncbi:MAG: hypothetical protein ORN49_14655 [Rhodobacteraceae bacterium]|nr:hypothetical protein [Paracoccaceae bacterium]
MTTVALSGCGSRVFETSYAAPVSVDVSKTWHVADVVVSLPKKLTVSEEHVYEPKADIVWREDPMGDRRPQVAAIMKEAISRGAKGLHGGRAVRMEATLIRFHALTFETESLNLAGIGVHNIDFTLRVVDAHSGEVLAGPDTIDASLPALTGTEMIKARLRGESQKSQIEAHVAATIAGWLGTGPDQRDSFVRIGG